MSIHDRFVRYSGRRARIVGYLRDGVFLIQDGRTRRAVHRSRFAFIGSRK